MDTLIKILCLTLLFAYSFGGNAGSGQKKKQKEPKPKDTDCFHNGVSIASSKCDLLCKVAFPGLSDKDKSGFCRKGYCTCAWQEWVEEFGIMMPRESTLDKIDKLQKSYDKKLLRKSLKKTGKEGETSVLSTELSRPSCSRWASESREVKE